MPDWDNRRDDSIVMLGHFEMTWYTVYSAAVGTLQKQGVEHMTFCPEHDRTFWLGEVIMPMSGMTMTNKLPVFSNRWVRKITRWHLMYLNVKAHWQWKTFIHSSEFKRKTQFPHCIGAIDGKQLISQNIVGHFSVLLLTALERWHWLLFMDKN